MLLHLLVFFLSIIGGIGFTYLYHSVFQHDRYFSTLSKVAKVERSMIRGMKNIQGIDLLAEQNIKSFGDIFEPLKCLVPVKIVLEKSQTQVEYTNIPTKKERSEIKICQRYGYEFDNPNWGNPADNNIVLGRYIIKIGLYNTPDLLGDFLRWIKHPNEWLTSSFDRITIPFLMLTVLFYSISFALLWAYRAKHVSIDMKEVLDEVTNSK